MRVKLSYTIEEDKVFEETGQLLGLRAGTLQGVIDLFTAVQTELQQKDEPVNVARVQQQIGELREGLVLVDLLCEGLLLFYRGIFRVQMA